MDIWYTEYPVTTKNDYEQDFIPVTNAEEIFLIKRCGKIINSPRICLFSADTKLTIIAAGVLTLKRVTGMSGGK